MLVYSEERQSMQSNRLHYFSDHYQQSDREVDFRNCTTFDELIALLKELEENNLHLIGSRDYVYHSGSMISVLESIKYLLSIDPNYQVTFWNVLTRTAGLRETAIKICKFKQKGPDTGLSKHV